MDTLKRLYRFGYTAQIMSFNDIAESCSRDLFHNITKPGHCLHELLSCYAERPDSLRPRGHDYVLPVCSKKLHKQSFLVSTLALCHVTCFQRSFSINRAINR